MGPTAKRIAPGAYDALLEALAVFYWKKSDLARFLRSELKGHPELLAGLNLDDPKRRTAEELVSRLSQDEERYQPVSIALLQQLAAFDDTFPHLRRWDDSEHLIANASMALAEVRRWVDAYSELAAQREAAEKQAEEDEERYAARRSMSAELAQIKSAYLELSADSSDPQERGRAFEGVLNTLFALWDLTPRGPFVLSNEQIDGAFTFDTDDYILEAG